MSSILRIHGHPNVTYENAREQTNAKLNRDNYNYGLNIYEKIKSYISKELKLLLKFLFGNLQSTVFPCVGICLIGFSLPRQVESLLLNF